MSAPPALAPDAAMVLGIAATAIPFARTPEDEAERWLRVLRLHGEVGHALQSLGVSEDAIGIHPQNGQGDPRGGAGGGSASAAWGPVGEARGRPGAEGGSRDVIAVVGEHAARIAAERRAAGVATTDLLMALLQVYGRVFEQALRAHGTDSDEVLERLAAAAY